MSHWHDFNKMALREEIGTVKLGDSVWTMTRSLTGLDVYIESPEHTTRRLDVAGMIKAEIQRIEGAK